MENDIAALDCNILIMGGLDKYPFFGSRMMSAVHTICVAVPDRNNDLLVSAAPL